MILSDRIRSALSVGTILALSLCSCSSKDSPSDSGTEYDYVYDVAEEFQIPTVERVGIYTFEQVHTPEELFDDFLMQYVDEETIAKGEKYYITGAPEGIAWEYENKIGDMAFNGYFIYDELPPEEIPEVGQEPVETDEYYYVNEFDKITITLDGKEGKLSDLLDDAKQRLEAASKTLGFDIKLKPIYTVVHSSNDIANMAEIMFSIDNGDGSGINILHDLTLDEEMSPYFTFCARYRTFDGIPVVCNYRGIILPKSFDEKKDHISCEEAMQKASDVLAPNIDLTLHYAQLEYRPVVTEYDKSIWASSERFEYQYGATYTSEPYWALYFDVTSNFQRVVYVNALSGEVELLFNN